MSRRRAAGSGARTGSTYRTTFAARGRWIITAVTRGLNKGIGERLQVESEQFAAAVPTGDLNEGINA